VPEGWIRVGGVLFATFGLQYLGTAAGDWAAAAAAARRHSDNLAGRQVAMERQREGLATQARERARQREEGGGGAAAGNGNGAAAANGAAGANGLTWSEPDEAAGTGGGGAPRNGAPAPAPALESGLYDFYSVPPAAAGDTGAGAGAAAAAQQQHSQQQSQHSGQQQHSQQGSQQQGGQQQEAAAQERAGDLLRYSSDGFYAATVWSRLLLAAAFCALVALGHAERGLLLLAALNAVGALSMAVALRRQRRMHGGLAA
jgi:hypothetical protein